MNSLPYTLDDKTLEFSKNILSLCGTIKVTTITRPLIDQLVRSATSVGANYAEANNAASKQDFRNKIFIAKKEAAETKYWLKLVSDYTDDKEMARKLIQDCHHLLMTFQKIVNTLSKPKTENTP